MKKLFVGLALLALTVADASAQNFGGGAPFFPPANFSMDNAIHFPYQMNCNFTITGSPNGVGVCFNPTGTTTGASDFTGHVLGIQGNSDVALTGAVTQTLAIAGEFAVDVTCATCTLTAAHVVDAKIGAQASSNDIGTVDMFWVLTGGVAHWTDIVAYSCGNGAMAFNAGHGKCFDNEDNGLQNVFKGQTIVNNSQEVGPDEFSVPTGQFIFGVDHDAATGTITNLNTTTVWSPVYIGQTTTFTKIGLNVQTGVGAATCTVALYTANGSGAAGAPLIGPSALDASGTGDISATVSVQLFPGKYIEGVNCTSNSVVLNGYTERGSFRFFPPSTSTGNDVKMTSTGAITFTANPAMVRATTGTLPLIWLNR